MENTSRQEKAKQLFESGCLCAQAVLTAFAPECGLTDEQAMKLGACFGTGMRKGEVCGACTGGLMALGMLCSRPGEDRAAGRPRADEANDEMTARFGKTCGALRCRDLLGCDVTTEEGIAYAIEHHLFLDRCPGYVAAAVEIVDEIRGAAD